MINLSSRHILITLLLTLVFSAGVKGTEQNDTLAEFEQLLDNHKGKVVYLDFWASWCGPCRQSFPWMNEMQSKFQQQGLVVLSVNVDSDKKFATEFLAEQPANFGIFYDPKGRVARKFALKGMPSSFIIDRSGDIVSRHVGFTEPKKQRYQQELTTLLSQ